MSDRNEVKHSISVMVAGIGLIGVLYAWIAYADEISNDVNQNAAMIAANTKNKITLDPAATQLMIQVSTAVVTGQNNAIEAELFSNPNAMSPVAAMITNHFTNYCIPNLEIGSNCPTDVLLQAGDIKVSSILSGTVYDSARSQAAQIYLTNLFDPPGGPAITQFSTPLGAPEDPGTQAIVAQALADEAVVSVARQPFLEMIAKRMPSSSNGPSEMQLMEQQAIERFMSNTWRNSVTTMTAQQLAQEQVRMQAYQLWMDYQRYRQMERIEALLGVVVMQNFRQQKALANATSSAKPSSTQINNAVQSAGGVPGMGNVTTGGTP